MLKSTGNVEGGLVAEEQKGFHSDATMSVLWLHFAPYLYCHTLSFAEH